MRKRWISPLRTALIPCEQYFGKRLSTVAVRTAKSVATAKVTDSQDAPRERSSAAPEPWGGMGSTGPRLVRVNSSRAHFRRRCGALKEGVDGRFRSCQSRCDARAIVSHTTNVSRQLLGCGTNGGMT